MLNFSQTKVERQESISPGSMVWPPSHPLASAMAKDLLTPEERDARKSERLENQKRTLEYLPDWLRLKGVSQRTLAEHLKTTEGSVSKWLSGTDQMPVGVLRQIAMILKANPGDLLQPPKNGSLGQQVEETLTIMDELEPGEWNRVMEVARAIRDAKKR